MIDHRFLGVPLHRRQTRRRFVVCYWLAVGIALAALSQFRMPQDVSHWTTFVRLLLTLGVASNMPLLLGGFSLGGAVAFYEGSRFRKRYADPNPELRGFAIVWRKGWLRFASNPERAHQLRRFFQAVRPVDERETQLRDEAHHAAHRMLFWIIYAGAIAYLIVSAISQTLLDRFGFVLLELLLIASMSLPQCWILWNSPDIDLSDRNIPHPEAACEPN